MLCHEMYCYAVLWVQALYRNDARHCCAMLRAKTCASSPPCPLRLSLATSRTEQGHHRPVPMICLHFPMIRAMICTWVGGRGCTCAPQLLPCRPPGKRCSRFPLWPTLCRRSICTNRAACASRTCQHGTQQHSTQDNIEHEIET